MSNKVTNGLNDLVETLTNRIAEYRFSRNMGLIEFYHGLGEDIVKHNAYSKRKKGSGRLITALADRLAVSEQVLRNSVNFYEKYPRLSHAVGSLSPDKKSLSWTRDIRPLLPGYRKETEKVEKCKHCEFHCPKDR